MKAFSLLLDCLSHASSDEAKIVYLRKYLQDVSASERGYAVGIVTRELNLPAIRLPLLKSRLLDRVDPKLFELSLSFVTDLSETMALLWPAIAEKPISLPDVVTRLNNAEKGEETAVVEDLLNHLPASKRWVVLKLVTARKKPIIAPRLVKAALARWAGKSSQEVAEIWPTLPPPYTELFEWLEGKGERPDVKGRAVFLPMQSAGNFDQTKLNQIKSQDFAVARKWDGLRVQLSSFEQETKLFTSEGDDITALFPDAVKLTTDNSVFEGDLVIVRDGEIQPANELQPRLNRKSATKKLQESHPARFIIDDVLILKGQDVRSRIYSQRYEDLEKYFGDQSNCKVTKTLPCLDEPTLLDLRKATTQERGVVGIRLKRWDAPYEEKNRAGCWLDWLNPPKEARLVLLYAEKGKGAMSPLYSEFTLGTLNQNDAGETLALPVGKSTFEGDKEELASINQWIENNVVERFGPVRSVNLGLVFRVTFGAVQPSARRKSGLILTSLSVEQVLWEESWIEATTRQELLGLMD